VDRMAIFLNNGPLRGSSERAFRRKDYLAFYPELGNATATRDLLQAVQRGKIGMEGTKRTAHYHIVLRGQKYRGT